MKNAQLSIIASSMFVASMASAFPMKTEDLVRRVFENSDYQTILNSGNAMFNDIAKVERIPLTNQVRGLCRWTSKSASAVAVTFQLGDNQKVVLFGSDGPGEDVTSCEQ